MLDRIPVEQITAQAREVRVGRSLFALLALIPFVLGWLSGKLVTLVIWIGRALAWIAVAVKAGYLEARNPQGDGG